MLLLCGPRACSAKTTGLMQIFKNPVFYVRRDAQQDILKNFYSQPLFWPKI